MKSNLIIALMLIFIPSASFSAPTEEGKKAILKMELLVKKLKLALGEKYYYIESQNYAGAPDNTIYYPVGINTPSFDYDIKKTDSIKKPFEGVIDIELKFSSIRTTNANCASMVFGKYSQGLKAVTKEQALQLLNDQSCNPEVTEAFDYDNAKLTYYWENGAWKLSNISGSAGSVFSVLATGTHETRQLIYDPKGIQGILMGIIKK